MSLPANVDPGISATLSEVVTYALKISRRVKIYSTGFYLKLRSSVDYPDGLDTRRSGTLIYKSELADFGVRGNALVTLEFLETLTDVAKLDVVESARIIAGIINQCVSTQADLRRIASAMGPEWEVELVPSNGAAGPCARALRLASHALSADGAPLLPLIGCDRDGQCFCRYKVSPR